MPYELFVALRYLHAKRRQTFFSAITLLSVLGVTAGVMVMVTALSILSGFSEDLKTKILGTKAHVWVLRYGGKFTDWQEARNRILTLPGVSGATPFLLNQGLLASASTVVGVAIQGIDPATVGEAVQLKTYVKEGSIEGLEGLQEYTGPSDAGEEETLRLPGIVIGKELSRNLGVFYGEKVHLVSPSGSASALGIMVPRIRAFKVVGIFDSGMYEYDSSIVYISLAESQRFARSEGRVTGLEVRVQDVDRADRTAERIQGLLGYPYYARDWKEMNRNLFSALWLEKVVMFIVVVFIVIVAALGIVIALVMLVMEKSKEIAILKAMGSSRRSISTIFVVQGTLIGLAGTLLGLAAGYVLCVLFHRYIRLPGDVYYISQLPVRMSGWVFAMVGTCAFFITLLATLYPSWHASRLSPSEGLRYE